MLSRSRRYFALRRLPLLRLAERLLSATARFNFISVCNRSWGGVTETWFSRAPGILCFLAEKRRPRDLEPEGHDTNESGTGNKIVHAVGKSGGAWGGRVSLFIVNGDE